MNEAGRPSLRVRLGTGWKSTWDFLEAHHPIVNLFATVVLGLMAAFVSCRVAAITESQKRFQELAVLPQIRMQVHPDDYQRDRLLIENFGGTLNHLHASSCAFFTARICAIGSRDSVLTFLQAIGFFEPIALTYKPQGEIAVARGDDQASEYATQLFAGGAFFRDTTVAVRVGAIHHLVHLTYQDLLGKNYDREFVVDSEDYWSVDPRHARELTDSLVARTRQGNAITPWSFDGVSWSACGRRLLPSAPRRDRAILQSLLITE